MRRAVFALFLSVFLISGCGAVQKTVEPDKFLDPIQKGAKIDIEVPKPTLKDPNVKKEPKWESIIKKLVPLYADPYFDPKMPPSHKKVVPTSNTYELEINSFHKATLAQVYTWIYDHLGDVGLRIGKKSELQDVDPLVYIEEDGRAYIFAFDKDAMLKIEVDNMPLNPGWVRVMYNGNTYKNPNDY